MSATQNKTDDKVSTKKDVNVEAAFKKLINVLVARGVLKEHQVEEILKEIK